MIALILTGALLGGWALRSAGTQSGAWRVGLLVIGWLVFAASLVLSIRLAGPMKGPATAAAIAPIGSLGIVWAGRRWREAREARSRDAAPEPLQGKEKAWRGVIRFLLAGPLGMLAAMGLAFCYASWSPGALVTRLLVAALLVPALWGLAMTWTLADQRLLRATAVLMGASVLGFGLALLKGIT